MKTFDWETDFNNSFLIKINFINKFDIKKKKNFNKFIQDNGDG